MDKKQKPYTDDEIIERITENQELPVLVTDTLKKISGDKTNVVGQVKRDLRLVLKTWLEKYYEAQPQGIANKDTKDLHWLFEAIWDSEIAMEHFGTPSSPACYFAYALIKDIRAGINPNHPTKNDDLESWVECLAMLYSDPAL